MMNPNSISHRKHNKVYVSEHFYSIQGEGNTMGVPSIFLRLAGCNLMCGGKGTEKDGLLHDGATWRCDSIEVWNKLSKGYYFADLIKELELQYQITKRLSGHKTQFIITGGEPLLQQHSLIGFLQDLREYVNFIFPVEIETNGLIIPNNYLDCYISKYNVSPKLSNSGMPYEKRILSDENIKFFNSTNSIYKFVVATNKDIDEVEQYLQRGLDIEKIWLMPACDKREDLHVTAEFVVNECLRMGVKYSSRLQLEIWDKKTGV